MFRGGVLKKSNIRLALLEKPRRRMATAIGGGKSALEKKSSVSNVKSVCSCARV